MSISGHGAGYFDVKYKIMVLGESKVDKTQLIKRYTKNVFGGVYLTTVGMDFQDKIIEIEDKKVRLQIWDTAGQERFRNVTKSYFQSSQGLVLVYDITDRESFEKLNFWVDNIKNFAPENAKFILVGNKCDLANERKVSYEEGENYAKNLNIKFFEASARDGTNVNELFFYLANEIYQDNKLKGNNNSNNGVILRLAPSNNVKRFGCF
jgi:Ras-related protein Rab-1A